MQGDERVQLTSARQFIDFIVAAQGDERATEPEGYDSNDIDDFDTGTTGPTVDQQSIDPDNSVTAHQKSAILQSNDPTDVQENVPLSEIASRFAPLNDRHRLDGTGDDHMDRLKDRIDREGVRDPVILDLSGPWIQDGNHRYQVAQELGLPSLPCAVMVGQDSGGVRYASPSSMGIKTTSNAVTAAALPDYQQKALNKINAAPKPTQADHARYNRSLKDNPRAGGELRGNSHDRHARNQKLLNEFGDGKTAKCSYCGTKVDHSSLQQDKIYPHCGYRYKNLIPACKTCNEARSNGDVHQFMKSRRTAALSPQYVQTGKPTLEDVDRLIESYIEMYGHPPDPDAVERLEGKVASWADVQAKAKRIKTEGGIRIISVMGPYVTAHVEGDDGVYETTLQRGSSHEILQWTCSCPWFAYSFGRSGRWKKYEGRMCSHALALQYQAQSEGMFGKDIKEEQTTPTWDDKVTYYEAPAPKEWRVGSVAHPNVLYHQTFAYEAIDREGLKGRVEDDMQFPVYLSDSPEGASYRVDVTGLELEEDSSDHDDLNEGWYEYYGVIPPKRLTRIANWSVPAPKASLDSPLATAHSIGYDRIFGRVKGSVTKEADSVLDVAELARSLMNQYGLSDWGFQWTRATGSFGETNYKTKTIGLSKPLTEVNGRPAIEDTIRHEIAHALVGYGAGHNLEWKAKAIEVGANPSASGEGESVAPKVIGTCPSCGGESNRQRMPRSDYGCARDSCRDLPFEDRQIGFRRVGTSIISGAQVAAACKDPSASTVLSEIFGPYGNSPTHGGCLVVAEALRILFGGQIKALIDDRGPEVERMMKEEGSWPMIQHYVLAVNGQYLDGNGAHSEYEITTDEEFNIMGTKVPSLLVDATPELMSHNRGIISPVGAAEKFADYLQSYGQSKTSSVDPHKGIMVAVRPPEGVCKALHLDEEGSEALDQLHVTLAYIGPDQANAIDLDELRQIVKAEALLNIPIQATYTGYGLFEHAGADGKPVVALVDSEELQVARHHLVKALERAGIQISKEHGFLPHTTLTYEDVDFESLPPLDDATFEFGAFIISPPDGVWETYPIGWNESQVVTAAVDSEEDPETATRAKTDDELGSLYYPQAANMYYAGTLTGEEWDRYKQIFAKDFDLDRVEAVKTAGVGTIYRGYKIAFGLDDAPGLLHALLAHDDSSTAQILFNKLDGGDQTPMVGSPDRSGHFGWHWTLKWELAERFANLGSQRTVSINYLNSTFPIILEGQYESSDVESDGDKMTDGAVSGYGSGSANEEYEISLRSGAPVRVQAIHIFAPKDLEWALSVFEGDGDSLSLPGQWITLHTNRTVTATHEDDEVLTAELHEEPEGALPATDGAEDSETYETDEQNNSHLSDSEEAGPTTIAWLNPGISSEGVKEDNMDIAAAARNYLMTSTAVKTFTFAEQQAIINEGEGVMAANLDRLQLEGTHYQALEQKLLEADETGEPVLWW